MRIHDKYEKRGYFWLPDHEDHRVHGTLTITDGGNIELEIVGHFEEKSELQDKEIEFERIIGHIEQGGLVTLEDCFYVKKSYPFQKITRSSLCVNSALIGVGYEKSEVIAFNSVSFTVEGINEWLGVRGLDVSHEDSYRTVTIKYKAQEEINLELSDGFKLKIRFASPSRFKAFEATISQQAYLTLHSDKPKEFSEFIDVISKLTYFLCFAIDSNVTISDVSAKSNDLTMEISNGKKLPVPIKAYYTSLPFSKEAPKIYDHRMLFQFEKIRGNAEEIINMWLEAYSRISPAIGLYFSSVAGEHKYLEYRFLALAQGLETYHRRTSSDDTLMEDGQYQSLVESILSLVPKAHIEWLKGRLRYGNEISLAKRIKRIIDPYESYLGSNRERSRLIRKLVDTRNYLTHYSEELEKRAAKENALYTLCLKMEAIFQLHLLQQIGFSEAEIKTILSMNHKLKQKLE